MKAIKLLVAGIGLIVMTACSDKLSKMAEEEASQTPVELAKTYVEHNIYIDVDVKGLSERLTDPASRSSVDAEELAAIKAAIYRFYKNVTVKDGLYSCSIANGADINVSPQVFSALYNNMNETNAQIEAARLKGERIEIQVPDSAYLNSLLQ